MHSNFYVFYANILLELLKNIFLKAFEIEDGKVKIHLPSNHLPLKE